MRILLIEDDAVLGPAVREHLTADAHAVDLVMDLADARAAIGTVAYELVLLDLALPDGSGLELLRQMRAGRDWRPVIILTARDQISERIAGLQAGADDYLVKPFDLHELTARLQAVTRRATGTATPPLRLGSVELDLTGMQASVDGAEVILTAREWALVQRLAQRPGAVIGRDRLEETLYAFGSEVESNAVEAHVSRIRKKLGHEFIQTLRGLGYRLAG
jgi:two-component system OmpR family response regulator